jgi:hypothetical protein
MKKIKLNLIAMILVTIGILASCELDSYQSPNAELSGSFIDEQTQELVQQDIIRGTDIRLTEHGYDPVANQYLNAKPDGTYMDKMLFSNRYTVQPERGNFVPVEAQEIMIEGKTTLDFIVTPYIRVNDVSIVKSGSKIIATFKLEQNVDNNISRIGLYGHPNPIAGQPIRTVATEMSVNAVVDPNDTFTLEIDIPANSANLETGHQYFFRVGALIDVPEAKFNYAPTVRLGI